VAGATLTVENGWAGLKVGEPARISNEKGFFAEATVAALKDNGDKTSTVTLDKDLGVPLDAKLSNPRATGAGFKIAGCHLGNTRSRGILIKSDNGLIKDNTIEACGMAGISAGPEYYWNEADYVQHLTIEGNTLRGNGRMGWGGGAVLIHGDGAVGNHDITVKGNRFLGNYCSDIDAQWIDGLSVTSNSITGPTQWPASAPPKPAVALANCRAVSFADNVVKNAAVYKTPLVAVGANVVDLQHNDDGGIHADAAPLVIRRPGTG